jgi:hypothetical protein
MSSDDTNSDDSKHPDIPNPMQIFLQEKSNFLKSNESFTEKFNKSCTEFEKLLLQSSGLFCVDLGCSNENFPSHEKNIKNR